MNSTFSEDIAIVGVIDPDANAAGNLTSDWADAGLFGEITAIVTVGTLGTSGTIDCVLQQATDSSGTGAKDITGKAITQITQAGTDQSDTQAVVSVRAEELDTANGFSYVAAKLTTGTATSDSGVVLLGRLPRHAPASDNDLASVGEIV